MFQRLHQLKSRVIKTGTWFEGLPTCKTKTCFQQCVHRTYAVISYLPGGQDAKEPRDVATELVALEDLLEAPWLLM